MLIPTLILLVGIGIFFILYRNITRNQISEVNTLSIRKQRLKEKYDFLRNQKRELRKALKEKKHELETLRNNQEGIRTISADDLDIEEVDANKKISRFLLQEGKITLEQNEKVLAKMDVLQMDYLGVCMALGIIDLATAKRAMKINKIASKQISLD